MSFSCISGTVPATAFSSPPLDSSSKTTLNASGLSFFRKNLRSMVKKFKFVPFDCISGTVRFRKILGCLSLFTVKMVLVFAVHFNFLNFKSPHELKKISLNLQDKKHDVMPKKIALYYFQNLSFSFFISARSSDLQIVRRRMTSDCWTSDDVGHQMTLDIG